MTLAELRDKADAKLVDFWQLLTTKQDAYHADATWTVQNSASDNSNTNYSVTALFSKEV